MFSGIFLVYNDQPYNAECNHYLLFDFRFTSLAYEFKKNNFLR